MKKISICLFSILLFVSLADSQEKKPGKSKSPPSMVVVEEIREGKIQPKNEFVGTVYYARVSDVASEEDGIAEKTFFQEGDNVRKGKRLVKLGDDLLKKTISGTKANYEQATAELERARKDLQRYKTLYEQKSIAESVYEDYLLKVNVLSKKADALEASLERLRLSLEKKTIRSPFNGVVISRNVEEGEWVSRGSTVAVIADNNELDVVVDVPENVLGFIDKGDEIPITKNDRKYTGEFQALIPRGDISTRTFSVKIRLENPGGWIEGMEARALLPSKKPIQGLLVSRDAVVSKFGREVVFVVIDSRANMVPVEVLGYEGKKMGIRGKGLEPWMKAIVKGNERIRDGQPVQVKKASP